MLQRGWDGINAAHKAAYLMHSGKLGTEVKLNWKQQQNSDAPKAIDQSCLTVADSGEPLYTYIGLDVDHDQYYYAYGKKLLPAGRVREGAANSTRRNVGIFSTVALAQVGENQAKDMSFLELKGMLSSIQIDTRMYASSLLGQDFDRYQNDAVNDLFKPDQTPQYVAALLRGLVTGIDKYTERTKLAVGNADRDLDEALPYIGDKLPEIVLLSSYPNQEVRILARRLMERYPVSGFGAIFNKLHEEAQQKGCDAVKNSPSLEGQLYSSIFYYSSRISQFSTKSSLTVDDIKKIDAISSTGYSMVECLSENLKVDAELLTFSKIAVFGKFKETANLAHRSAVQFVSDTENSTYYAPSDINVAKRFIEDEKIMELPQIKPPQKVESFSGLWAVLWLAGMLGLIFFTLNTGIRRSRR
jgi:hypothetical protein